MSLAPRKATARVSLIILEQKMKTLNLRNSHRAFKQADSCSSGVSSISHALHLIVARQYELRFVRELRLVAFHVRNVRLQLIQRPHWTHFRDRELNLLLQDEGGNDLVPFIVLVVQQHHDKIEAGEKRRRQGHVDRETLVSVIVAFWIRRGDDGGTSVQLANQSCFGDTQGLLLHRLMDAGSIVLAHATKLVDAAQAAIGEHKRAGLQRPLAGILHSSDCEACAGGSDPRGHDRSRNELGSILQELRLACSWVSNKQQMGFAANFRASHIDSLNAANKNKHDRNLHHVHSKNQRTERADDFVPTPHGGAGMTRPKELKLLPQLFSDCDPSSLFVVDTNVVDPHDNFDVAPFVGF
eukprot:m.115879 g.115879  ORF g.115879 m.115879 type:complete len:354 (-) comp51922_c0_seq19:791-1852(-)